MKITVIYNQVESLDLENPDDVLADQDTVQTAKEVINALKSLGFDVRSFAVNTSDTKDLRNYETDLFFNNGYGIGNVAKSESELASLLESTNIPYTGSDAKTLTLTLDKMATKDILIASNVPTPYFQIFNDDEKLCSKLRFPLIVKPNNQDCSFGLDASSVVENKEKLFEQIKLLQKKYPDPVLVEEYIPGRELNVTVLGNGDSAVVLPVSEIVFGKNFPGKYKIVDFTSKWKTDSMEYKETNGVCPADLDTQVLRKIKNVSLAAYNVTKCRDYARIDIRLSNDNIPYILEVNANPGIGMADGTTRSAKAAGYSYPEFLKKIVEVVIDRYKN